MGKKFLEETPGTVLVEWYAPWCGHCKALEPEYKKAAAALSKLEDPKITLAKIDATQNAASAQANGVQGSPTLKIFSDGGKVKKDYKGARQEAGIISAMKKAAGPSLQAVSVASILASVILGSSSLERAAAAFLYSGSSALQWPHQGAYHSTRTVPGVSSRNFL